MTPKERFDNNMALARDSLRRAGDQLDRAVDELMQDERERALIEYQHYSTATPLKSARSRVKSLLKELARYEMASPQAVITQFDVEEVLINGGHLEQLSHDKFVDHYGLLNDQGDVVAYVDKAVLNSAMFSIRPPLTEDGARR